MLGALGPISGFENLLKPLVDQAALDPDVIKRLVEQKAVSSPSSKLQSRPKLTELNYHDNIHDTEETPDSATEQLQISQRYDNRLPSKAHAKNRSQEDIIPKILSKAASKHSEAFTDGRRPYNVNTPLENQSEAQSQVIDSDDDRPSMSRSTNNLRRSKLEAAKNLKVPAKFGSQSRNNEMYSPKSGSQIPAGFSKNFTNMSGAELSRQPGNKLPREMFESASNSPTNRSRISRTNAAGGNNRDAQGPQTDEVSNSSFRMDKQARDFLNKPKGGIGSGELVKDKKFAEPSRKRATIPQFETLLSEDFFSDDVIITFTMVLEYLRRHVFMDEALSERMDLLYLGHFQHEISEEVGFEDVEYIMQSYGVFITRTEIEALFLFLDENNTGKISLGEIHDSLVAFLQIYETITFEFYEGFKMLHQAIKNKINLEEFKDYLVDNSEKFHIRNEYLQDYVENYLGLKDPVVAQTLATCGDFIYFDNSYTFNILNYLLFIEHYEGNELSFEYVNSLHHYQKFKTLIEVKVLFVLYEAYKIKSPNFEALAENVQARFDKVVNNYPSRVSFRQFEQLLHDLKIRETTVWENMILFKIAMISDRPDTNQPLKKTTLVDVSDVKAFVDRIILDKRGVGQTSNMEGNFASSLLTDKKRKPGNAIGEKYVYTYEVDIERVEDLCLNHCDYCDLSIMYHFPGEEQPIESQIFTYLPEDHGTPA